MPRETLGRLAAIERDRADRRHAPQQAHNRIRDLARAHDARVETAAPLDALVHVPDADADRLQAADALGVRQLHARVEQCAHERPEQILRMPVRLAQLQRTHARYGAQYEHTAIHSDLWRKTRHLVCTREWAKARHGRYYHALTHCIFCYNYTDAQDPCRFILLNFPETRALR